MSLVIDTSDLDTEIASEEYLSEESTELDATQELEGDSSDDHVEESEPELELESSEPPPPAETSIAQRDDDDDADDFKSKIWNAEMRCRGKEAIVEDLKEQLKFAKADYEDAVASLRKLATWGKDPVTTQAKLEVSTPNENIHRTYADHISNEVAVESHEVPDESWKTHSLIEMIKSADIDGLGKKKLESLEDVCKTFGDFEELRTKASLDGVHLKEVLPTGFGEKITDQIEEAYFSAIKTISSQPAPAREYKPDDLPSQTSDNWVDADSDEPVETKEVIEPVCESTSNVTPSKSISLDDL